MHSICLQARATVQRQPIISTACHFLDILSNKPSHAISVTLTMCLCICMRMALCTIYVYVYMCTHMHIFYYMCCREFNLSGAHPKTSKQAALERHEQQQQDSKMRPHTCSSGRGRSQSAGKQRGTGEHRLEQLARPKTAHWDKCECMCVL